MNKHKKNISIAIPTYNSSAYLNLLIKQLGKSGVVNEIVISDDGSLSSEIKNIKVIISKNKNYFPKINFKILENTKRSGPFINKYLCIENCNNDLVYQIDSDNLPMLNFDKFVKNTLIPNFEKENIYYPSKIFQFRKYNYLSIPASYLFQGTKYKVILKNKSYEFTKDIIQNSIKHGTQITDDKNRRWLLNIGNYFVDKNIFIDSMKEGLNFTKEQLFAADQFLVSYLWLKYNKSIKVMKNHYHFHRKRTDSISFEEKDRTGKNFEIVENMILDLV